MFPFIAKQGPLLSPAVRRSLLPLMLLCAVLLALAGCAGAPSPQKEAEETKESQQVKEQQTYEEIRNAISKGKPREAIQYFEKQYSTAPEDLESQLLYASLLITARELQRAEEVLQGVLQQHSEQPEALYDLALIRGMQGRTEDQKRLLERSISDNNGSADAHASLAEIYVQEEKFEKATEQFQRSLEIREDNFSARMGYGHLLLRQGKYDKALTQLNRAIELNPSFSLAYADRGKALAKKEKIDKALKDYTRAIELDATNYWNRIDRGRLYLEIGKMDKAEEDFSRAAELKPDFFLAFVYLAGLYEDREKRELALKNYEQVLELNPDYYPAYKPAALLHFLNQDYHRAAELYQREYQRDGRDHGIALMRAVCLLKSNQSKTAREFLSSAMQKMDRESIFYHLARMYNDKNYVNYVMNQLKTLDSKPQEMRAVFYLAAFYELQGNEKLARKYYLEVSDANLFGLYETRIAKVKLDGAIEEQRS